MDAREYLRLAKKLVAGSTEAEWRSAVSRAYYAVFHVARKLLLSFGFEVKHGDQAHAYLWRRLCNCGNVTVQNAGNSLNYARGDRNKADYDFDVDFTREVAVGVVVQCEEIIKTLEVAATDPLKSQITEAMKTYERDILKEETWHP